MSLRPATKEKYSIRHGYDAVRRLEEAGDLIGELLGDYHPAFMDLIGETGEIAQELLDRTDPDTVKNWIVPKRAALLAELQRRGLDNFADARHAFCKIDAVLSWVDRWKTRTAS